MVARGVVAVLGVVETLEAVEAVETLEVVEALEVVEVLEVAGMQKRVEEAVQVNLGNSVVEEEVVVMLEAEEGQIWVIVVVELVAGEHGDDGDGCGDARVWVKLPL